jgi:hypothetical protein
MTLGGLLKHLAYVEDHWFSRGLHRRDRQPPWDMVDWDAGPDWDGHSVAGDTPGGRQHPGREVLPGAGPGLDEGQQHQARPQPGPARSPLPPAPGRFRQPGGPASVAVLAPRREARTSSNVTRPLAWPGARWSPRRRAAAAWPCCGSSPRGSGQSRFCTRTGAPLAADLVGHRTTIVTQKVYRAPAQASDSQGCHDDELDLHQARGAPDRMTLWLPVWLPSDFQCSKNQWAVLGLNQWPLPCQGSALPLS